MKPGRPKIRKILDLSVPIESLDTPVFPGDPPPLKASFATIKHEGFATFLWTLGDHAGTHVDAPAHFLEEGKTIDLVPIQSTIGYGIVLDFSEKKPRDQITRKDLQREIKLWKKKVLPGSILLMHTGYSKKSRTDAWLDHPWLSEDASKYLADLGVRAVGTDASSPDRAPYPAHKILLAKEIPLYENLARLEELLDKEFLFVGAPLALVGGSASPVRALAILF